MHFNYEILPKLFRNILMLLYNFIAELLQLLFPHTFITKENHIQIKFPFLFIQYSLISLYLLNFQYFPYFPCRFIDT